ncbi:co-chaperone GroES [Patescibacteria group bacterium]
MANIQPTADHLVVEAVEEETTASGIIIPDTASKEKPQKGKVIAVGPGKMGDDNERIPMEVKEGDTVLFTKYAPSEIEVDGKDLLVLNESDVLAILK